MTGCGFVLFSRLLGAATSLASLARGSDIHFSPSWSIGIMSDDRIPMTREGYEKLKTDLDRMQNKEMIEVAQRIAAARELGDLSENAEYHAAREDQGMLQARIDSLKDKLSRAYFVDRSTMATDE